MENVIPTIEQAPQVPEGGFVPVVPTVETNESPVIPTGASESKTTANKEALIRTPETGPTVESQNAPADPWKGCGYVPSVDSDGNETKGDFMSSLVLAKGNGTPVTT